MIELYGIPNCNTVKKARQWLEEHAIEYRFHNFKREGVDPDRLDRWLDRLGWETLVNRRGTTWRRLPEEARTDLNRDKARELLLAHASLVKRPVLEAGEALWVGFDPDRYEALR
ncbi:ArsC family reductase [Methylohalobius crimeensis]|uniref:ArsC family reductase n=1 Tax=Methylohalobius crimeensis TaxID=244365 RepID=UPI0003B51C2B|nr:ArsC family reductase [Methylohalobius crimeensis]